MTEIQQTPPPVIAPITMQSDEERTALQSSIAKIVNTLTDSHKSAIDMDQTKMSEDVLYAALTLNELRKKGGDAANCYLENLKKHFNSRTKRCDSQPLTKAVNDSLNNVVAARLIRESKKNEIITRSFSGAQLDGNKTSLSRTSQNGGIKKIEDKIQQNTIASAKTVDSFKKTIETPGRITRKQAEQQRNTLDDIVTSMKRVSRRPQPVVVTTKPGGVDTGPTITIPPEAKPQPVDLFPGQPAIEGTHPNEFLYIPENKNDGDATIVLPNKYRDVQRISFRNSLGGLEELTASGTTSDGRIYFRSKKKPSELGNNLEVHLSFSDNTGLDLYVGDSTKIYRDAYSS